MSRKGGGWRLQCAEAAPAADWSCCFLGLPPVAPSGVGGDGGGFDLSWSLHQSFHPPTGLFASVGQQVGVGFPGSSSSAPSPEVPRDPYVKYVSPEVGHRVLETPLPGEGVELREKGKKKVVKLKIKVGNPHLKRLISGAIAGAVSRTAVAPLETIRTHLMVGSNGNSTTEVFQSIMKHEGWTGLFRGNFVNVIRVAPSKAIELFAFDTANKFLTPKPGEEKKIPIPPSLVAGAFAGVSSTLCTYPLELIKTRLTIQRGVYNNFFDAFVKIIREEGPTELYRGLTPSLIGVVPYAATNYFAYDTLKKVYKKIFKTNEIGNIPTLLIGSAAGAMSSTATFPLEVARAPEKLFRVVGMYEALADVQPDLEALFVGCDDAEFFSGEVSNAVAQLAHTVRATVEEFGHVIRGDASRRPVHGGEIHPMTRYVLNYCGLLADSRDTLDAVLLLGDDQFSADDFTDASTPSSARCMRRLLTLLLRKMDEKARLYDDAGLRNIFLMNNLYYVVQKVMDSPPLRELLGDDWLRRHRGQIRQYEAGYLRASWIAVLSGLRDDAAAGDAHRAVRDQARAFNAAFEEMYRAQTAWKVADEQLREELRIAVSERLIPAYRSFLARASRVSGRHVRYYSLEDLENYMLDFFEGVQKFVR